MVSQATFHFGEFTYDGGSHQLLRGRARRHLSPKARLLLERLLVARPKALSREELYDALWPSTFVCETNLASVVNEVRRALGDAVRAPRYIRTVHGFGYAFCGEAAVCASASPTVAFLVCGDRRHALQGGENFVGRSHDCGIVIPEATVSRRHASIRVYDDAFSIRDLDSKNGTYVNGRRLGRAPLMVTGPARIAFGSIEASIDFQRSSSTVSLRLDLAEVRRAIAEAIRV